MHPFSIYISPDKSILNKLRLSSSLMFGSFEQFTMFVLTHFFLSPFFDVSHPFTSL